MVGVAAALFAPVQAGRSRALRDRAELVGRIRLVILARAVSKTGRFRVERDATSAFGDRQPRREGRVGARATDSSSGAWIWLRPNAHDAGADVKKRLAGLLAATASGDRISAGPASAQSGQAHGVERA